MTSEDSQLAFVLDDVGIYYNLAISRPRTLKSFAGEVIRREFKMRMLRRHWAIRGVSFTVRRGETLGIVGANGSGKTTLMLALAGVLPPDEGVVRIYGTPSLLTLGAGFAIELTGRQNIYLNAAYLGLSRRETDQLVDSIVDFSELGEFIDVPLRQYSTGMRGRLGFSIVSNMRPDILLLDEALSAGDRAFQEKSRARLGELMQRARAIVLVSHDLGFLEKICARVAWMSQGVLQEIGPTEEVLAKYRAAAAAATGDTEAPHAARLEGPRIRTG